MGREDQEEIDFQGGNIGIYGLFYLILFSRKAFF
jgi:hypothetical protein